MIEKIKAGLEPKAKHTPGPWSFYLPFGDAIGSIASPTITDAEKKDIADLYGPRKHANARLIAAAVNACFMAAPKNPLAFAEAAPKMLELLREVAHIADGEVWNNELDMNEAFACRVAARALLAKIDVETECTFAYWAGLRRGER